MSVGKTAKRLESEVQQLHNIINSLVEENYELKTILTQYTTTPQKSNQGKQHNP